MKHYGKLTAAAAAGFMTLSAMGVTQVAAATSTANVTVTVSKTENVKDPVGTITFKADPRTPGASEKPLYGADIIEAGPDDGISVASVAFTPGDSDTQTTTKTAAITIDASKFASMPVGHYCYTITQDNSNIDGLPVVNTAYRANVFKTNDGFYLTVDNGNGTKLTDEDISFANTYTTKTLTVKKVIAGNQANMTDTFPFTITIDPSTDGERFNVSSNARIVYGTSGDVATVTAQLGHENEVTISGLSATDAAAIQETFTKSKGYVVTSSAGTVTTSTEGETTTAAIASTAMGTDNKTVTITNTKSGDIPTGILMSAAPYVGLVGLGGIFAGLFFRRKRED